MKSWKYLILLFLGVNLFQSCSEDAKEEPFDYSAAPFSVSSDVKFVNNLAYDSNDFTTLDAFLPSSTTPSGMVIFIHGGGFSLGTKEDIYDESDGQDLINMVLENNIAFVTIDYRLLENGDTSGVIKSMSDSRRALQYIRSRADDFNINKEDIVLAGISAGAGTSLWIGFNDDMQIPNASDLVLRESTRVKGIAAIETQATYDLEKWTDVVFKEWNLSFGLFLATQGSLIAQFYGLSDISEYNNEATTTYRQSVDMLDLMTIDDPEFYVQNTSQPLEYSFDLNLIYHHAYHARTLKEKADAIGVKNVAYYGPDATTFSDPSNESLVDFIIRKIEE